jgi:LysM domain
LNVKNFSAAILLVASFVARPLFACGPSFPNNLLDSGDTAVLQAPVADFQRELERMDLKPQTHAVPLDAGQKFYEQSTEAEISDLTAAFKREKIPDAQAVAILQTHLAERMKLNVFLKEQNEWEHFSCGDYWDTNVERYLPLPNTNPLPVCPEISVTPGLPSEFSLYFQGAIAWQKNEIWRASELWEQLLDLPPEQRHFKSTWAAFMLGKYYENPTNDWTDREATNHFEQVRILVKNGFADSLGLATASLGEEAKIFLRRTNYPSAIELYLAQFAAGDGSAADSLRIVARRVLTDTNCSPEKLNSLATNSQSRRVITAYLISRKDGDNSNSNWLAAVDSAKVSDVESAEQLALAAYQSADFEAAQRWVNHSKKSSVSQWLQAKLDLRAGRISEAAKILTTVSRAFPQDFYHTNENKNFADSLYVDINPDYHDQIAVGRQALGELGVLHLARREYTEALDALLRSGYWQDAAYVAERVLTTDELKSYVERRWPAITGKDDSEIKNYFSDEPFSPRKNVRWLLARRLARENRFETASPYFPTEWQTAISAFAKKISDSRDENFSGQQRAFALRAAAYQMRTNGMELFGTELAPDWFVEGCDFEYGVTWQARATNSAGDKINVASDDEIGRAARHGVEPDERWHYRTLALRMRYQAADLAWDAAQTMPDNSDDTARFLCIAGTWLKKIDPEAADKFYKALVNRCRKTAIGAQADRMRWFPILDENGNPKPWPPPRKNSDETNDISPPLESNWKGQGTYFEPQPGGTYIVRVGDSLAAITRKAGVTIKSLNEANPNLNPSFLQVGQMLVIPKSSDTETNAPR